MLFICRRPYDIRKHAKSHNENIDVSLESISTLLDSKQIKGLTTSSCAPLSLPLLRNIDFSSDIHGKFVTGSEISMCAFCWCVFAEIKTRDEHVTRKHLNQGEPPFNSFVANGFSFSVLERERTINNKPCKSREVFVFVDDYIIWAKKVKEMKKRQLNQGILSIVLKVLNL